eukprot:8182996-Pyramimonas_sp.AAC.1
MSGDGWDILAFSGITLTVIGELIGFPTDSRQIPNRFPIRFPTDSRQIPNRFPIRFPTRFPTDS